MIIFNNKAGEANISMGLDETARAIPAIFIQKEFGDALTKQAYKLVFNNMKEKQAIKCFITHFSIFVLDRTITLFSIHCLC